jgi:hypothetical protein
MQARLAKLFLRGGLMFYSRRRVAALTCLALVLAFLTSPAASAEETAAQAEKKKSLEVMRGQAQRMIVRLGAGEDQVDCELNEQPLIHYSDQVRRLPESTLWVWQQDGVPVLFCKIERLADAEGVTKSWQYCCVPATDQKADVTWGRDYRWRMREPAFRWSPIAAPAEPRDTPRARLSQMKVLAREFNGRTEQTPTKSTQEMRLLASPLYQYAAEEKNVVDGAVFGLTSNGTNPDALLLIEALREPEGESKWRFGILGMTGDAVEVFHQQKSVWSKEFSEGPGDFRSWIWYLAAP